MAAPGWYCAEGKKFSSTFKGFRLPPETFEKTGAISSSHRRSGIYSEQVRGFDVAICSSRCAGGDSTKPRNEKDPPCGEPKSLLRMVPAPRVELGTY